MKRLPLIAVAGLATLTLAGPASAHSAVCGPDGSYRSSDARWTLVSVVNGKATWSDGYRDTKTYPACPKTEPTPAPTPVTPEVTPSTAPVIPVTPAEPPHLIPSLPVEPKATPVYRIHLDKEIVVPGPGKAGPNYTVRVGNLVTFRIRVTNLGTAPLRGIVVTDLLPVGGYLVAGGAPGATVENGAITWRFPTLGVGLARSFTVRMRTSRDVAKRICNVAYAGSTAPRKLTTTGSACFNVKIPPRRVVARVTG